MGPWRADYLNAYLCSVIENTGRWFLRKRTKGTKVSAHMPAWWETRSASTRRPRAADIQRKLEGWARTLPPAMRSG